MRLNSLPTSFVLAVLIGAINTYLLLFAWTFIGVATPLPQLLISHEVRGVAFKGILFAVDLLTNMALYLPAAYLLCKLKPERIWVYLIAASLLPLWLNYRLLLFSVFQGSVFLPGAIGAILPLPATTLIIKRLVAGAPNNSFKPRPLRGSA